MLWQPGEQIQTNKQTNRQTDRLLYPWPPTRASGNYYLYVYLATVTKLPSSSCRFSPDYTLTQVSTTLRIQASTGNEFLYPLLAVLPHQLLAACIALQPRPEWEKTLAWLSVPFWLLVILCIVATAFVQTKFGMRGSSVSYRNEAKATKVFDLKTWSNSMSVLSKKIQELGEKKSVQSSCV